MLTKLSQTLNLSALTLAIVLLFGASYALAWTAPTAPAPGGNAPAPINTSATAQTKAGNLTISATTTTNGLRVLNGAGVNKVLTSDASGNASWQAQTGGGGVGLNASLGAPYWYHPGCGYGGACQCPGNSLMVGTYGWWASYTDVYYLCRNILN